MSDKKIVIINDDQLSTLISVREGDIIEIHSAAELSRIDNGELVTLCTKRSGEFALRACVDATVFYIEHASGNAVIQIAKVYTEPAVAVAEPIKASAYPISKVRIGRWARQASRSRRLTPSDNQQNRKR